MEYQEFLKSKRLIKPPQGLEIEAIDLHPALFEFQKAIVKWAVRQGRAAILADVGLGKTIMFSEWARQLNVPTLILAPLAVAQQTVEMAQDILGMQIDYVRDMSQVHPGQKFYITNYEMVEHFDTKYFEAVVLDESSILKAFSGVTKKKLIKLFKATPYKLCCTATPAPNDLLEIGNHAEFLGVMNSNKMTSIFFIKGDNQGAYRLKKHAKESFYQWLASWAVAIKKPSDLGFKDKGYNLPPVETNLITVDSHYTPEGMLPGFYASNPSAVEAKKIRRATIEARAKVVAEMVNASDEQWLIWTALNDEADLLNTLLEDSVNVHGSLSLEKKIEGIQAFTHGNVKVLITKASIAGMGINMQNCHNMLFFGIDFSWESYYQCIGRIVRFGQKADRVNLYVVTSQQEISIYHTIEQKGKEAEEMTKQLIKASKKYVQANILEHVIAGLDYKESVSEHDKWTLYLGDSCQVMPRLQSESVDLMIYSPPFSSIYIYTAIPEDLGNVMDYDQFLQHYNYIVEETYRLLKPGCLACVHIQDFKLYANRDGARGIYPMSDDVVQLHMQAGFTYRARITIDKDPQLVATRNHDTDLLFVTGKRDSTDLAPMHTDYLLIFKKEGDREQPVKPYESGEMTEQQWIEWARAVWYDIRETDVLNTKVARANEDERHICPLQLGLIERAIKMWSNKGEVVFSPFAGIGSELYEAVRLGRYGLGVELKPEYHKVACQNISNAERLSGMDLFAWAASQQQLIAE